ncbi:hypothetical protein IC232_09515 [Microvirga sp. BT688]|uniref:hypothetical protein n=1 Tax=Microvirga sp. TaxID=1873136 RepID=UPI0016877B45|nr:hypothetical protein [Microvirga sp.]MBD2746932.1 hypothetical protein [Microvirga sp.]
MAWSSQQRLAIPVFTEILAFNSNDIEALIGRGNALNDITEHKATLVDSEVVLALQPINVEAIRCAATAERSMGLPRATLARLEPLFTSDYRKPATLFIAAQARREMGRPDLAEGYARAVLAQKPADEGAQRLLEQIGLERRPSIQVESRYARRSYDPAIRFLQASHELTVNNGLTKFAPQACFMRYQGGDFPSVDMYSIGTSGRHRFDDFFEFESSLLLNLEEEERRNRADGNEDQEVTLTHETTFSLIPSDPLRFDLIRSQSRAPVGGREHALNRERYPGQ